MRIEKARGILVAEKVLKEMRKLDGPKGCFADTYKNGRENGFSVVNWKGAQMRVAVIAENRNSDNIVVYTGNDCIEGISDEMYATRKMFDPGEYKHAAEYAVQYLAGY